MVMKGTLYRVKLNKMTDDQARREFEWWLHQTGRDRLIDWLSIRIDQSEPDATYAEGRTR
jgi:hypothetical protein